MDGTQQFSDVPDGYKILPPPTSYSDVPDGYKVLPPTRPSLPSSPAAQSSITPQSSPAPAPLDMSQVPGAVPKVQPPIPQELQGPPTNQYRAAPNQETPEVRLGRAIPQAAVPALEAANVVAQAPVKMGTAVGKVGGEIAETLAANPGQIASRVLSTPPVPLVSPQQFEKEHPVAAGLSKGIGQTVGGIAGNPTNWPFFASGAAQPVLRHIINLGFRGMMAKGALDAAMTLHDQWDKLTPEQRVQIATEGGITAYMAVGGGQIRDALSKPYEATPKGAESVFRSLVYNNTAKSVPETPTLEQAAALHQDALRNLHPDVNPAHAEDAKNLNAAWQEYKQTLSQAAQYNDVPEGYKVLPSEPKPVVHTSNDVEKLRKSAESHAQKVGDAVAKAVEPVPGAKVEAVRDAKDADRIEAKADRQGVQPSQVADISAAKVTVPDQAAATQVLTNLNQELPVKTAEGSVTGEPGKNAVRQVQAIVGTNAPAGEPVKHAEVLLQTPEMHAATEESHDQYRKAQELRAAGKEAEAQAIEAKLAQTHIAADQAARARQEEENAIQKRSSTQLHGSTQETAIEAGSKHAGMGGGQQGQEVAAARPGATVQEKEAPAARPAGSAPIPPRRLSAGSSAIVSGQPSVAPIPPSENLRGQQVQIRDSDGNWKTGTVLADVINGANNGARHLRGVFEDGTKFNNVKPRDVRKGPAKAAEGVDFDGTLFKENADGSIGEPIPERIASLKQRIAAGDNVIIESRRATRPGEAGKIQDALESVGLPRLPVTAKKTAAPTLVGDKEPSEPGVKVQEVATNANTPLPGGETDTEAILRGARETPPEKPAENMVPKEARASTIIAKDEQEAIAAKMESRGAAKAELEKGPGSPEYEALRAKVEKLEGKSVPEAKPVSAGPKPVEQAAEKPAEVAHSNTPEGNARHVAAMDQARQKLGLKPGEFHKDLLKTADEIERASRGGAPKPPAEVKKRDWATIHAEEKAKKAAAEGLASQARAKEVATRLRSVADRMDGQIEDKRRPMTQNPTPKRMAEYRSRVIEGDDMERTQKAMRALADAHEAGNVPTELAALRSKDEIGRLVHKGLDTSGGYYSRIPKRDYYDKSPAGQKLQEMIEGAKSPEATAEKLAKEKASKISQLEADVQFQKLPGFFPTPKPVIEKMLSAANIRAGDKVLEPSAGKGDIADAIREKAPDAKLDTVEQQYSLQKILELKGHNLAGEDFLEHKGQYDKIVMNPPFEKGADVEHVRHAYDLLKPGGRLVAIMSPHADFASDKKSADFRDWMDSLGGKSEKLPEGSFKESGTGSNSRMVVIDKPETKVPAEAKPETPAKPEWHNLDEKIVWRGKTMTRAEAIAKEPAANDDILAARPAESYGPKPPAKIEKVEPEPEPTKAEKTFIGDVKKRAADLRDKIKALKEETSAPAAYFQDSAKNASYREDRSRKIAQLSEYESELTDIQQEHKYDLAKEVKPATPVPESGKNFEGRYLKAAIEPARKTWKEIMSEDMYAKAARGKPIGRITPPKGEETLLVKVPDDGTFLIPNTPQGLEHAVKAADKFVPEKEPKSAAPSVPRSPKEFDAEKYITGIEKEIADLNDQIGKAGDLQKAYLEEQLKAAKENLTEAKKMTPEESERVVPGARSATTGNETGSTSIRDLTDSIGRQVPSKRPLRDRINQGADIGAKADDLKGALGKVYGRLKGASAALWDAYTRPPKWTDYEDATGKWSGADQINARDLYDFTAALKKAIPDKIRREAISNWIEAGGNEEVLRERADKSANRYKPGYAKALHLSDEEKTIARNIMNRNDATLEEAQKAGLMQQGVENYVRHVYADSPKYQAKVAAEMNFASLNTKPSFTKQRVLPTYFDAEQLGFTPKDKDVGYLTAIHERSFREALAARDYIRALMDGKASDGRPLVMTSWASAKELDPREGEKSTAYLIKPNIKATEEYGDYRKLDHPALRDWRWAGKTSEGDPIFVQGDALIHPEIYSKLRNNLSKSAIRSYEMEALGHTVHPGAFVLNASAEIKHAILSFSGFHQTTLGMHAAEHRTMPAGMPDLDLNQPKQRKLIEHGLMVAQYDAEEAFGEGVASGGLVTKIPGVGPVYGHYVNYLFHDYLPRVKMATALNALERNRSRYEGKLSDDQIYAITAAQTNASFGGLNYRMMGRNKTIQDVLRIGLMAPDFFEARARYTGQAAKPYGREQLVALLGGALVLYTIGRILNEITDRDPHWDKPFSVIYRDKEYSMRPIQEDIFRAVTTPGKYFMARLSPVVSTAIHLGEGRNEFGRKESIGDVIKGAAKQEVPIPAQPWLRESKDSNAEKAVETIAKMVGVNVRGAHDASEERLRDKEREGEEIVKDLTVAERTGDQETLDKIENDPEKQRILEEHEVWSGYLNELRDIDRQMKEVRDARNISDEDRRSNLSALRDARRELLKQSDEAVKKARATDYLNQR